VEVNEVAARIFRRYWILLVAAVLLPMVTVAGLVARQQPTYTAHARILAAAATPRAQAEASAVVSQVQALATSRDVVVGALADARITVDADAVVKRLVVTGLGTSALVDLAYTDGDPGRAQQITAVLSRAVTKQLDAVRIGGLPNVLADVDKQLTQLASKRAPIAATAQANPHDPVAQNRLAGIDRLISDLSGDRNRLAEDAAAAGHSSIVATPTRPGTPDSKGLLAKLAIALLLGLALGLVTAGINETLRPAVSGTSRLGRLLDVPVLGTIRPDPAALANVGRRIRLAARHAGVSTVVLVRATRTPLPPELVDRVEAATLRPQPAPGRAAIPIDNREQPGRRATANGSPVATDYGSPAGTDNHTAVALLTASENSGRPLQLHRLYALDELDPSAEAERIGVVVLAGATTRVAAVGSIRDLLAASGWPLLGVLGDPGHHRRRGGRA
jgi:capsular polysaccharide biosynthesis protein